MAPLWKTKPERLGVSRFSFHTFPMSMTASFYQAAKVPPRRTGWKFTNPKFDFSSSTPLAQKPRVRKRTRKPKWAK